MRLPDLSTDVLCQGGGVVHLWSCVHSTVTANRTFIAELFALPGGVGVHESRNPLVHDLLHPPVPVQLTLRMSIQDPAE